MDLWRQMEDGGNLLIQDIAFNYETFTLYTEKYQSGKNLSAGRSPVRVARKSLAIRNGCAAKRLAGLFY